MTDFRPAIIPTTHTAYTKYLPAPSPYIKELIQNASGTLSYGLTNDYLFRALLQENNHVLKCLICAVLHLPLSSVVSVVITNPILLGSDITQKTFILDVNVILNDNTLINLEMQVENLGNWPERSLGYLCRNFTSLNKGDEYLNAKPAIHISFLDYTLFPNQPEFHGVYKLFNEKKHKLYTDKFILHVIELNQTHEAADEDCQYELDKWATLFKATTWEEIKMLAEQTPLFESVAETLYQLDSDPAIQWMCESHQASVATVNYLKRNLDERDSIIADKDSQIAEQASLLADQASQIAELQAKLEASCKSDK